MRELIQDYKTAKKYNKFVENIENNLRKERFDKKIDDWSKTTRNRLVFESIYSSFVKSFEFWFFIREPLSIKNEDTKIDDIISINNDFHTIYTTLFTLSKGMDIDFMKIIDIHLENENSLIKATAAQNNNFSEELMLFSSSLSSKPELMTGGIEFNKLIDLYNSPKELAIASIIGFIRSSNESYLRYQIQNGLLNIHNKNIETKNNNFFTLISKKEKLFFKKRFNTNYEELLKTIYARLANNNLIISEKTNEKTFIDILSTNNINNISGSIYFNINTTQIAYILIQKLAVNFKGNYEETIIKSEKFILKPFANKENRPFGKRHINDFNSNYKKKGARKNIKDIKGALLINKIFEL